MFKSIALVVCLAVAAFAFAYEDYHTHPKYEFKYGVEDTHTGDNKEQWEHRDGDDVKGSYSLHEPDGTYRVVEYNSEKDGGFQAHVQRSGHAQHPAVYGDHHDEHGQGGESYVKIEQHY